MNSEDFYNDLPNFLKENIGFPTNYMLLSRDQQEFLNCLCEKSQGFTMQPFKETLEYIMGEMAELIETIQ